MRNRTPVFTPTDVCDDATITYEQRIKMNRQMDAFLQSRGIPTGQDAFRASMKYTKGKRRLGSIHRQEKEHEEEIYD